MSGNKSSGSSESRSYTPAQSQWLSKALQVYGPQLGAGENVYPGQRIADFSPFQNETINQAQSLLGSFAPNQAMQNFSGSLSPLGSYSPNQGVSSFGDFLGQAGMPLFGETGNALSQILSGQSGAPLLSMGQANDTFNAQYANPAYRNFSQNTAPLIREEFAGPGFWSSARADAVGRSASDLGSQLEASRAGYLWDTENVNRQIQEAQAGRQLAGIPLGMQYAQEPLNRALAEYQATMAGQAFNNQTNLDNRNQMLQEALAQFNTGLQGYQANQQTQQINNQANLANRNQLMQETQNLFGLGSAEQQQRQAMINTEIQRFMEENRLTSEEDMAILLALLGMNYSSGSSSQSGWGFGLA
jgi:hypothetical protein